MSLTDDQGFNPIFVAAFGGTAGELTQTTFGGDRILRGDVDGDASADFAIVLTGNPPLAVAELFP